jgi:hypothetical protein
MRKQVLIVPFLFSLAFLAIFMGCGKSSSNPAASPSLITQAAWKYDTSGIDLNKDGVIDIGDTTLLPCEKDNTYLFKKDSTGVMDEGATKCNAGDPQSTGFSWALTNNQTVLTLSGNALLAGSLNISSVTATKFILYKDTTFSGVSFRYIFSLKH